jgi:tetratricopeptide (TPR) repeat protein
VHQSRSRFAEVRSPWQCLRGIAVVLLACTVFSAPLQAQSAPPRLTPKRTLTVGAAPGCELPVVGQTPAVRRDNAEARRLAAAGQEAALIGDQAAARDAFVRAAILNPGDERIAYDLGRAHEELADSAKAIGELCRYLSLSPAGREALDVRERLRRLVPAAAQRQAADVQVAFQLGLALFDDGRYTAAIAAFGDVVRDAPTASEGYFNRGLAYAANRSRIAALQDLEQYRANAPTVDDRVQVGRAIEVLRRPVYEPSIAFARSIIPGVGQFYTGRPVRGVIVLAAVGVASGLALTQQTTSETVAYVDPNGAPAPYTRTTQQRAYLTAGLGAAAAVTILGMIDAVASANRSQRGATILARAGQSAARGGIAPSVAVAPWFDGAQRSSGLKASLRF